MVKILAVIQNIEQNSQLCQYLTQDNNIDFKITSDEVSVLKQYYDFRPDIFILDTKYFNIIEELSLDDYEIHKCNTILLYSSITELLTLTNWSKIYKIFLKNTNYKNVLKAIYELSNFTLERKIDRLFLKLHIPLESTPSKRVRKTLIKCCNSPNLLGNLNTLFNAVGKELGTTGEGIRSSFRTALKPLNEFKDKENLPFAIYKFFPKGEEVTPKLFLDISIYYLKNTKK
jgi:hypothetical protein